MLRLAVVEMADKVNRGLLRYLGSSQQLLESGYPLDPLEAG